MVYVTGVTDDGGSPVLWAVEPHGESGGGGQLRSGFSVWDSTALPGEPLAIAVDAVDTGTTDDDAQILVVTAPASGATSGALVGVDTREDAIAWRMAGVAFGAILVGLIYLLAATMFRRRRIAVLAAIFVAVDGMSYVMSRIAMNDIFTATFIVAAYLLFWQVWSGRWRGSAWWALPLTGVLIGLAAASKWVGFYALAGLLILVLVRSPLGRLLLVGDDRLPAHRGGHRRAVAVPRRLRGGIRDRDAHRLALADPAARRGAAGTAGHRPRPGRHRSGVRARLRAGCRPAAEGRGRDGVRLPGPRRAGVVAGVDHAGGGGRPDHRAGRVLAPRPQRRALVGAGGARRLLVAVGRGVPRHRAARRLLPCLRAVFGARPHDRDPERRTGLRLVARRAPRPDVRLPLRPTAGHPSSSPWWSWPLDLKPTWFYGHSYDDRTTAAIYNGGNPVLFWAGIPAMVFAGIMAWRRRSLALVLVVVAFAFQFLPWTRIERATFMYHYFTAVLFAMVALAYAVDELLVRPDWRPYGIAFLSLAAVAGILVFPLGSALAMPDWYINAARALPPWNYAFQFPGPPSGERAQLVSSNLPKLLGGLAVGFVAAVFALLGRDVWESERARRAAAGDGAADGSPDPDDDPGATPRFE